MTKGTTRAAKRNAERQAANDAALAATVGPEEAVRNRIRTAAERRDEATRMRILGLKVAPPAEGPNTHALTLKTAADVAVDVNLLGRVTHAMRWDVFELMLKRASRNDPDAFSQAHHNAARRLQDDIAILYGTQGGNASTCAGGSTPDPLQAWLTEDFSIRRVLAAVRLNGRPPSPEGAQRVQGVLNLLDRWAARLLLALCIPEIVEGRRVNWRDTVKRLTGERDAVAQGKLVRRACNALAGAYATIDNEPVRGAA